MKKTAVRRLLSLCAALLALVQMAGVILPASAETQDGYPRYFHTMYASVAEVRANSQALVREVESEGVVLLKNEGGLLPLASGSSVALYGVTVLDPVYGGTGSGAVESALAPNYLDAIEGAGFTVVNRALMDKYCEGEYRRYVSEIAEVKWSRLKSWSNAEGDVIGMGEHAIYIVGRVGGEGNDLVHTGVIDTYNNAGDYLTLNENERSILENLAAMKADGDIASITVIINSANPISAAFLDDPAYGVDAALWVGSVGQTGVWAVADVLSGAVNPSGSLPDTWWTDNQLNPVQNNFGVYTYAGSTGKDSRTDRYVVYQEGVYLGYKYTETRYEDVVLGTPRAGDFRYSDVVAYPFGYGLSYTTFHLSDMRVSKERETGAQAVSLAAEADRAAARERTDVVYTVQVKVTNTGDAAGKKTVQVYAQKPYTNYDRGFGIEKPSVELVGYAKTRLLQPGESETVTVTVPEYFLTSYDAMNTGVFILQEGTHYLTAAGNAHEAVNNILSAKGKTVRDGMTGEGDASLVCALDYAFGAQTYAAAYGTGAQVKSLFAFADVNRYEGSGGNRVTYYSRSNWQGTVTSGSVRLSMTETMAEDMLLDDADLPDDSGVEFPVMGQPKEVQLIEMMDYAWDDPAWDAFMDQLTYEEMAQLLVNGLRMTDEVAAIGKPETLDHNGPSGVTQRFNAGPNGYAAQMDDPNKNFRGTAYPCNSILAATFNDELANRVGLMIGEECMWAGYAGIYGTGLNIHRSPYAGRVFEYYSEDAILTGLMGTAWTLGVQEKGVYVYNKHFVLNDQEQGRAGIGTWCNEQALRENYLRAFELPIVYVDAKCVMTAFNRLGAVWSGASRELVTDWLRGEAGMSGFAVTDMYDTIYMSRVHEILAGNDLPYHYTGRDLRDLADYGPEGAKANAVVANRMRESAKRVLYTVLHSRSMDGVVLPEESEESLLLHFFDSLF